MRNPKWHRDEIILALNLYFQLEPGQIHSKNPEVIELSKVLNKLPIHDVRPDSVKFRNPNGVGLKLSNFLAIDPDYDGTGMSSYSKLDNEVFDEFFNNRAELGRIAETIRQTAVNSSLALKLYRIEDEIDESAFAVREGKVIYKLHKFYERDGSINQRKKDIILKKYGCLKCEACGFDFKEIYGQIGTGYIECHHRKPLSELGTETQTTLDDLALVCSNCHRMIHRQLNTISVETLRGIISLNNH